jgi:predicted DNA-binding transcriptional regulator YafY
LPNVLNHKNVTSKNNVIGIYSTTFRPFRFAHAMSSSSHDKLVFRLAQMLVKLNQGEALNPPDLAREFGVNLRTVQRDLNERFAYLPLVKGDGRYRLDPTFLGKLGTRDIQRFASLAGISGLFPSLSDDFLRDIFDTRIQAALLVKGHNYEDLAGKETQFRQLEQAIVLHQRVSFHYRKDDSEKAYTAVEPYKLLNQKGIWYLAARDAGKLKTFSFTQISALNLMGERFTPDPTVDSTLVEEDGIWFGEDKKEIVLKIAAEVAGYFKRRKLIANQIIEKELEGGGLIVSARVGHPNQVLPIVRYWIPHIRIISPEGLQAEMELGMRNYLAP